MPEWKCNNCGKENEVGVPGSPTRYQCECGNVSVIQEFDIISQGMPAELCSKQKIEESKLAKVIKFELCSKQKIEESKLA